MVSKYQIHAPLLGVAVALIVGIIIGHETTTDIHLPLSLMAATLVMALLFRRHPTTQSVFILLTTCALGATLTARQRQRLHPTWTEGYATRQVVIVSEPQPRSKTMMMDALTVSGSVRKLRLYVMADSRSQQLQVGNIITINSKVEPFDRYATYFESHGFQGRAMVWADHWKRSKATLHNLSYTQRAKIRFLRWRHRLLSRIRHSGLEGEAYAVVAAMTMGDRSAITHELRDLYSITGASHVLAMSGLHLGIIYTLLSLMTVGRWRMLSQSLIVLCIWAFAFLVGLPASIVRSAVMLTVYSLFSIDYRNSMSVNTLAFTAIIMLLSNPYALFDVGFQLSYMSVFAILVFHPLLSDLIVLQSHGIMHRLWQMVCVSLSAQIGVAPLIAFYFGRFSTYFLLSNFVVIPAATLILYTTLAVVVIPAAAPILLFLVHTTNRALEVISRLPLSSIDHLHPTLLQIALIYTVIASLYIVMRKLMPYFFLRHSLTV